MAATPWATPPPPRDFAEDVVLLEQSGLKPVVCHGGGPQIARMLDKLGIKSEFKQGLRVTRRRDRRRGRDGPGRFGQQGDRRLHLARRRQGRSASAARDGNMVLAKKATRTIVDPDSKIEQVLDLGFVGEPETVDTTVLKAILKEELIPVLAPVCAAADGQTYNVNADTFAGAIAGALNAKRLLLLTDVPGVLDKDKQLIPELTIEQCRRLIADGTISGGMIPKIETCIYALEKGVEAVVILDGKGPARGADRALHRYRFGHDHPKVTQVVILGRSEAQTRESPDEKALVGALSGKRCSGRARA
jgi:acetylglutamate kinase